MKRPFSLLPKPGPPATLAIRLALRAARLQREVGVRELARELKISPAHMSGLELGPQALKLALVTRILTCLQVTRQEHDRIVDLLSRAKNANYIEPRDESTPPLRWTYEQIALKVTEWAPRLIPEILQTPGYIRALYNSGLFADQDIEQQVLSHLARRDILIPDSSASHGFLALLSDSALQCGSADKTVMLEQLHHLVNVSQYPHVRIQIVPTQVCHPDLVGTVTVFDLDRHPSAVALAQQHTTAYLTMASHVCQYQQTLRAITELSFDVHKSRQRITDAIDALLADQLVQ